MIAKACPVVLHPGGAPLRHLLLHHPQAGPQLVKGTVRAGEDPARAALRELLEEAGVRTVSGLPLGADEAIRDGEIWHFTLCRVAPDLPEAWQHFCADDGGQLFRFSWHPLEAPAPEGMAPMYLKALDWIRGAVG